MLQHVPPCTVSRALVKKVIVQLTTTKHIVPLGLKMCVVSEQAFLLLVQLCQRVPVQQQMVVCLLTVQMFGWPMVMVHLPCWTVPVQMLCVWQEQVVQLLPNNLSNVWLAQRFQHRKPLKHVESLLPTLLPILLLLVLLLVILVQFILWMLMVLKTC